MVSHFLMIVYIVRQLVGLAHMLMIDCIMIALFLGNVILWLIWLYDKLSFVYWIVNSVIYLTQLHSLFIDLIFNW